MSMEQDTHPLVESAPAAPEAAHAPGLLDVSGPMMLWTWVTFFLFCAVLYKVAWKPILNALEKRESDLRKSVEEAEKIRQELAGIEEQRRAAIAAADQKAREIVDAARQAAVEAAQAVESKARNEAKILLDNAQREISAAQNRAMASLRRESADLAVGLARKILRANLDEARTRAVTDQLIKEL
jgi:F-type H+-transporting ATPase subunit b